MNLPRNRPKIQVDIAAMRVRLNQEKPALGAWDVKAGQGGLVELEFILQAIRILAPGRNLPGSFFDHDKMGFGDHFITKNEQENLTQTHDFFHRILQITGLAIGRIGSVQQIPTRLQDVLLEGTEMKQTEEMEAMIMARPQTRCEDFGSNIISPDRRKVISSAFNCVHGRGFRRNNMRNSIYVTVGLFSATASVALASPAMKYTGPMPHPVHLFELADTNKDDQVSSIEAKHAREVLFDRLDRNGNGFLDKPEERVARKRASRSQEITSFWSKNGPSTGRR